MPSYLQIIRITAAVSLNGRSLTYISSGQELEAQRFLRVFDNQLDGIPGSEIRPAASTEAYRTHCVQWNPADYSKRVPGLAEGEEIYPVLNEREGTFIISSQSKGRT